MAKLFEIKEATGLIKDVDTTGKRVELYAAAYESVDSHRDTIHHGAFAKTIRENKDALVHLLHHDDKQPIGRPEFMEEDNYGLRVLSRISDTQMGRDALTLMADGILTQNSIGYYAIKHAPNEYGGRHLNELKLKEYSSVTWASNPAAKTLGIKAAVQELHTQEAVLLKALRTGNLADETYLMLEAKQAELKQAILDLIEDAPLTQESEPEAVTPTTLPVLPAEPESKNEDQSAHRMARFYAAFTK